LEKETLEHSIKVEKGNIKGVYKIHTALNNTSGVDIDAARNNPNGSRQVHLWQDNNTNRHKWYFDYNPSKKAYQIKNMEDRNLVLAWIVDSPDSRKVWAHPNKYKEEHYWILEECKDGYYIIKNKKDPTLVLDVTDSETANGTKIKVHPQHPPTEAIWNINAQKFN